MQQSFISFSYIWTRRAEIDYRKQIEMAATEMGGGGWRRRRRTGCLGGCGQRGGTGGGGKGCPCVSMNFWECMRKAEFTDVDGKAQITAAYQFDLLPPPTRAHTHTPLLFSGMHFKLNLFQMITSHFQEILHMEIYKGWAARSNTRFQTTRLSTFVRLSPLQVHTAPLALCTQRKNNCQGH